MDSDLSDLDTYEDILGFDVPDDTLERAAGVTEVEPRAREWRG